MPEERCTRCGQELKKPSDKEQHWHTVEPTSQKTETGRIRYKRTIPPGFVSDPFVS